ncbi:EAL domain-containing protein [Alteromonas sp. a30]|uniref:EAL domain-containing protein n=1 Tax=Alteromonas sp. a30 TaxID=2730917 RepID=UPI0022828A51|nr:EAL domain-containing protein [Alteromonas sp. a30]MCY7295716.1 EAL domain-containing protein [Alteromonas sp. a30]
MLRLVCCIFCCIAISASAWANTVVLDGQQSHVALDGKMQIGTFPTSAQLSYVIQQQDWRFTEQKYLKPNQAYWSRIHLLYQGDSPSRLTAIVNNPRLNYVDIFLVDGKGRIIESALMGTKRPFHNRPAPFRQFPLSFNVQPNDNLHLYIRIQDDGPVVFPVTIWETGELLDFEQTELLLVGIYSGALMILACYFLVTYILLKSRARFWFSVFNLAAFFLFLNLEGMLGQLTHFTEYSSSMTTILLAAALFCVGKVSHTLLHGVPNRLRIISYIAAISLMLSVTVVSSYWQIILSLVITSLIILLHAGMAFVYSNPYNSLPNKIYTLAWVFISLLVLPYLYLFYQGQLLSNISSIVLDVLLMLSILMLGVAIEAHENVLIKGRQEEQSNAISDLRRFYDFFKNSAEGLFTTHYDGRIISVNPAMCSLFGFNDEAHLLQYANSLDKLITSSTDLENIMQQLAHQHTALGREIRAIKQDGSEFWISLSVAAQEDNGQHLLFGSVVDITERKQNHISLAFLATHDPLTGIYNRRHFENELTDAIRQAQKNATPLSLLYLDVDQFKSVNDACGHKAGDELLKTLCQKLDNSLDDRSILGRMGGDEFAILMTGRDQDEAFTLAEHLLKAVQMHRFLWEDRLFSVGASIGLVHFNNNITNPEQMMSMADSACYIAKERGRGQIHCYSDQDTHIQRYEMELSWLSHINDALDAGNFVLYFQEYRSLKHVASGYHYELLIRMKDHDGKITPPSAFLPAAERYKLITKIDRWVVQEYFSWLAANREHLEHLEQCNINLGGQSLGDPELQLFIHQAFEKYQIPYHKICFEITESMAIIKLEETLQFMEKFKTLGCRFALDDFGIGFSSYEYLKNLPVDIVKIDGNFVRNILKDPIDKAMVRSMHDIATAMKMQSVAEYVEDKQIMVELGKIGVDYAQGYCISPPVPLDEISLQYSP